MYYKITNTESDVYKKLYAFRTKEILIEEENENAIAERIGLKYESFLGRPGQQNFSRTTEYEGFKFEDSDKVDPKLWKIADKNCYEPNRKTKAGRELSAWLANGLKKSSCFKLFDLVGAKHEAGRFSFPFLEIIGDVMILFLNPHEPTDENCIEITKREFDSIYSEIKTSNNA